jgi:6-phospho-beta-glucosidase
MKLAVIGGAGVRVPLLVNGLIRRGLPFSEVALFDPDTPRLEVIGSLAAARAGRARVTLHGSVTPCVAGADFVITSIRVGGLEARQQDEAVCLRLGLVGQETVGPAGFAMAVRTIAAMREYGRAIAVHAPDAWVINFTNPVGIVTQAMRREPGLRVVGICDTPTELFAEVAHALGVEPRECAFDYVGLNHLGWLREVSHRGRRLLAATWENPDLLSRLYSRRLFPPGYLSELKLLPTEYVYYYVFPERAVANIQAAGTSRGEAVRALTDRLFADLRRDGADRIAVYEAYLAARSASYMQIESGEPNPQPPSPWAELTGYDRIAFDVMHAILSDTRAVIPLNVDNAGNLPELSFDDVVEVPCVVDANGPRALHAGGLPDAARALTLQVKAYERSTIDAAEAMSRDALVGALAANPLVPSIDVASRLIDELTLPRGWRSPSASAKPRPAVAD